MSRRVDKTSTPGSFFSSLLEAREFVTGLPTRLNRIMDAISNHEVEVRVKAVDSALLLEGFQKIANRITTGLVLCFIAAAAGGGWLIWSIFELDAQTRKKAKLKP
jgi:ubiquinone biosynthesis protein